MSLHENEKIGRVLTEEIERKEQIMRYCVLIFGSSTWIFFHLVFLIFLLIINGYQTERSNPVHSTNGYFEVDYDTIMEGGIIRIFFSKLNRSQSYIMDNEIINTTFTPKEENHLLYLRMEIPKEIRKYTDGSYVATIKLFTLDKLIDYLQIEIAEVTLWI